MATDYNFAPELDEDMVDSQTSTTWAEQQYLRPIKVIQDDEQQ